MTAWLLWIVVACLSDGAVTKCSVQQATTASQLEKVSISCPSLMASNQEFKYLLLLNDTDVSQIQLTWTPDSASLFSGRFEVTPKNNGIYVCKMEVIYPPPFKEDCHSTEVRVNNVQEEQPVHAINSTTSSAIQSCPDRPPFIPEVVMYAACGLLLLYSLTVTCIALTTWRKMKKHRDDTSVYMNTRPVDHRKTYKA